MIPADVRLPCQDDPTKWDVPTSVNTHAEAAVVRACVADAVRICGDCPVLAGCGRQALADPPSYQVMAGHVWTRKHQPKSLADWTLLVREPQPCGTYPAYQRHIGADEEPCEACADAARKWARDRKRARLTRCPQGHPYDGDNTAKDARGHRVCLTCRPTWRTAA